MAETGLITIYHTYRKELFHPPVTAGCFWAHHQPQTEFSMLSCYVGAMDLRLEEAGADAAWKDGNGGGRMMKQKTYLKQLIYIYIYLFI